MAKVKKIECHFSGKGKGSLRMTTEKKTRWQHLSQIYISKKSDVILIIRELWLIEVNETEFFYSLCIPEQPINIISQQIVSLLFAL